MKNISFLLLCYALSGFLGCGPASQDSSSDTESGKPPIRRPVIKPEVAQMAVQGVKKLGVCLAGQNPIIEEGLRKGLSSFSAPFGFNLIFQTAEGQVAEQVKQIQNFREQAVDAIILQPLPGLEVETAITETCAAGMPVFTIESLTGIPCITTHIGPDDEQAGRMAAAYLARRWPEAKRIAILPSSYPGVKSRSRENGFREALAARPQIQFSTGTQEVDAVLFLEDLGVNPESPWPEGLPGVGFGVAGKMEHNPQLAALVVEYPEEIGEKAIQVLADYFAKKETPKVLTVRVGLVENRDGQNVVSRD